MIYNISGFRWWLPRYFYLDSHFFIFKINFNVNYFKIKFHKPLPLFLIGSGFDRKAICFALPFCAFFAWHTYTIINCCNNVNNFFKLFYFNFQSLGINRFFIF